MYRSIKFLAETNDVEMIEPSDGKQFTLKELQTHVGGYIRIYNYCELLSLIVNEQGFEQGQVYNHMATRIVQTMGYDILVFGNSIKCRNEHLYNRCRCK